MKSKVRAHVLITGRVQGVFFRSKTRNEAKKCDVNGWVRNLSNGKVEAIFEGKKEDVDKLIDFAGKGPSVAKVMDLNIEWKDYSGKFNAGENFLFSRRKNLRFLQILRYVISN